MNEKSTLVSVIVPMYNVQQYISECIESIQNQTYKNIEIILVDDGSPDCSGNIADKYAEENNRIKVIHKKNGGVSSARNTGIDAAKGDYICFVDGDDYVMPNYVDYLLNICINSNADVAYTADVYSTFHKEKILNPLIIELSPEEAIEALLCYKSPIGVYSKIFKKSLLNKNNIRFFEDVYIGEGFNFNALCFQYANKIIRSTERIYFYRRDNESSAMTKFKKDKCIMALHAIDLIKDNLKIRTQRVLKAWNFAHWHTHFDMYCWIYNSGTQKQHVDLYNTCKKVSRHNATVAFSVPTKQSERIRGLLGLIAPVIVAKLMLWRSKR